MTGSMLFLAFGLCRLRLSASVSLDVGCLDAVRSYYSVLYSSLPLIRTATANVIIPSQFGRVCSPISKRQTPWMANAEHRAVPLILPATCQAPVI